MLDKFSPIEILKAFGIVYLAGAATVIVAQVIAKMHQSEDNSPFD